MVCLFLNLFVPQNETSKSSQVRFVFWALAVIYYFSTRRRKFFLQERLETFIIICESKLHLNFCVISDWCVKIMVRKFFLNYNSDLCFIILCKLNKHVDPHCFLTTNNIVNELADLSWRFYRVGLSANRDVLSCTFKSSH